MFNARVRPFERAGGGHHFHSSGGGSGGGSSFGGGSHHSFLFFGGGGGGGGGGGAAFVLIALIVIVIVVVLVLRARRKRRGTSQGGGDGGAPTGSGASSYSGTTASGGAPAPWAAGAQGSPPPAGGWSHDDRPAIESVRGTLFPGTDAGADGAPPRTGETPDEGISAIVARDPAFDREAFLEQAQRAFFIVQEAWTDRKPEMSRQVMADGLWQQHRVQIKGYIDEHKRNLLGDLSVGSMNFVSAHTDASYDTIVVRVTAACSDYDVNDDGKVIRGDKRVETWSEDWTFQRSSNATTHASGGTLAQKCPNCGAPLNVDLAGVCPYCKAPVMSGAYDWVLARISQVG